MATAAKEPGLQLYGTDYKNPNAARVDESHTVISNGDIAVPNSSQHEVVEISSDSSSDEESESEPEPEPEPEAEERPKVEVHGVLRESGGEDERDGADESEEDAPVLNGRKERSLELGEDLAAEEPSFGEQLRAQVAEPIDVETSLANAAQEPTALTHIPGPRNLSAPSATSLATVLTQALRTNDRHLLESCFEMNDLESVRSTIERLPSPLVADLLARLAERIHKRPGRAGNLMVWVQWAIVCHGGYLASQPVIVNQLGSLIKVIKERASGLQPLLQLKGKLDMLSAQLDLRRAMQGAREREEEDDAVIYVEGEEEQDSLDETEALVPTRSRGHDLTSGRKGERSADAGADVSDDEEGMQPAVNGVIKNMEDESDSSGAEEDLFDDESDEEEEEETSESGLEDEPEEDDSGTEEIPESDEEPEQSLKRSTTGLPRAS